MKKEALTSCFLGKLLPFIIKRHYDLLYKPNVIFYIFQVIEKVQIFTHQPLRVY